MKAIIVMELDDLIKLLEAITEVSDVLSDEEIEAFINAHLDDLK